MYFALSGSAAHYGPQFPGFTRNVLDQTNFYLNESAFIIDSDIRPLTLLRIHGFITFSRNKMLFVYE